MAETDVLTVMEDRRRLMENSVKKFVVSSTRKLREQEPVGKQLMFTTNDTTRSPSISPDSDITTMPLDKPVSRTDAPSCSYPRIFHRFRDAATSSSTHINSSQPGNREFGKHDSHIEGEGEQQSKDEATVQDVEAFFAELNEIYERRNIKLKKNSKLYQKLQ